VIVTKQEAAIGVLTLEWPPEQVKDEEDRPGNLTNIETVDFRLKIEIVRGSIRDRFQAEDPALIPCFVEAAKKLEARGVKAIVGDCGMMATYQRVVASAVSVPVVTSGLILVPLVYQMLGEKKRIGIITPHSELAEKHFNAVGWSSNDIPIVLKVTRIERDTLLKAVKDLVIQSPDVGAFVAECTLIPPYSRAIQKATGLPIFDIVTITRMLYDAVNPPDYNHEMQ
jgi:Asp/Glu/hydantoin racemase